MRTYIISTEARDYIKIGKSVDPVKRLYELQTGSPYTLILEGYFDSDIEEHLHVLYNPHHKHLEWFTHNVLKEIAQLPGYIPYTGSHRSRQAKFINFLNTSGENKERIMKLSSKAQSMLLYILLHYYEENGEYLVKIDKSYYMKQAGITSNTTYLAAVDELIRYMFLQYTKYKTVYWTNPFLFSSSDRISKYPDRIIEKSDLT